MLLVRTGLLENPTLRDRCWYPHCADAEMETRKVTERAYGFTRKESEPAQVWSKNYVHMDTREREGKGQGKRRNLLWNDCFLVQEKEASSTLVPRIFVGARDSDRSNAFSPSGSPRGRGRGGAAAGRI